jgi:phosphoglycerol transferase MdoB-like AlkP superfamily enzyme
MILRFLAIVLTGLAVIAPAAHLFALPGKIHMSADDYFTVQRIYFGWWLVGLFLPAAFLANAALAVVARSDKPALWLAIAAMGLIAVNLTIFMIWTQPANAATQNWTTRPDNWEALRQQWEYSHAVNAGLTFLAFCATALAGSRGTT